MSTKKSDFDKFLQAVLEAAFFSQPEDDEGRQPVDNANLHPDNRAAIEAHAKSFWLRSWYYLDHEKGKHNGDVAQLGHDFWMTSQGHGCGFWDGGWITYGDTFTKLAKCYPEEMELCSEAECFGPMPG